MLEVLIGGVVMEAMEKKDHRRLDWLLARTLGRVAQRTETQSLHVHTTAAQQIEPKDPLALDSPTLTMAQLDAFEEKVAKIKQETKEKIVFKGVVDITPEES